jgi:hypothetical protein
MPDRFICAGSERLQPRQQRLERTINMSGNYWAIGAKDAVRAFVRVAALAACVLPLGAQTRVDLRTQSQDIDFTGAPTTKPLKAGVSLPATCGVGEGFFLTVTAPGQNLYLCTSPNTWSLQFSNGLGVTLTNSTTLTIGAACTITTQCTARVGGTVYVYLQSASITLGSVITTVRIYISDGSDGAPPGTIKVRSSVASGVTCSAACTVENSQTSFPGMSIPLGLWTAAGAGTWNATGSDLRSFLNTKPSPSVGPGIVIARGDTDSISADRTVVPLKYSGSGAPSTVTGSVLGDFYSDTTNNNTYQCFAVGPCTAVGPGNWVKTSTGPVSFLDAPWFLYGQASTVTGQNPSLGQGKSNGLVILGKVSTPARQMKRVALAALSAGVNDCGTGTSPCGMLIALLSEDRSTVLCQTVTGYGGNAATEQDLNSTGSKSLPFLSGTQVSSGVCTLASGNYWFAIATDSIELMIAADSSTAAGTLLSNGMPGNVLLGQILSGTTGAGTSLGFASLSGALTPITSVAIPMLVGVN